MIARAGYWLAQMAEQLDAKDMARQHYRTARRATRVDPMVALRSE